jgi:hypothetical protein
MKTAMPPLRHLLVIAAGLATLCLIAGSMGWRLVHDTALMQYLAWRMTEGSALYRDLYDMDLPGVFLLHALLLKTLGGSDLAWRIYDLLFLAASAGLIVLYGRRLGDTWSAVGAALLFSLYHLAGGASDMGQRDYMMVPFLLGGVYGVAVFRAAPERLWALFTAGLAVGVTLTLKPFAVVLVAALAIAAAAAGWPRPIAMLRHGATFGAGAALPNVLVYGWLALTGTLTPFLDGLFGYVRVYYGGMGASTLIELAERLIGPYAGPVGRALGRLGMPESLGWALVIATGALAAGAIAWSLRGRPGAWRFLALVGVGYGVIHILWQNKGFAYHAYPLVAFGCLAASALLAPRPGAPRRGLGLAMAVYVAIAGFLAVKAYVGPDRPWVAEKLAVVDTLSADLKPLVAGDGRVQVMDMTGGGIHALYQLRVAEPTKYIYDYHFYHPLDDTIRAMRADFVAALSRSAPAAVVMFKHNGLRSDYDRLAEFPALADLLATRYRLHLERRDYRVYVRL